MTSIRPAQVPLHKLLNDILDRRRDFDSDPESVVSSWELLHELLLLSPSDMAFSFLGCWRWRGTHCGLCARKTVYNHNLYWYLRNEDDETMGQITSVAVCREYRRLGLAHKLMRQSQIKMIEMYNCKTCALHVRESNYAARHMYENVLGFK